MPSSPPTLFASRIEAALAESPGWRADDAAAYCHRCGESLGPHEHRPEGCRRCAGSRLPWDRIVRLGAYQPPLSDWIVAMKFNRAWTWSTWMGEHLAPTVGAVETASRVAVCVVPMAWSRRVGRGYNQAGLMGRALARQCRWPTVPALARRRRLPPQTTVTRSQRAANASRAFAARRVDLSGWTIWLVDDVKTTGATLRACARRLRAAGADQVRVAVAAVTDG